MGGRHWGTASTWPGLRNLAGEHARHKVGAELRRVRTSYQGVSLLELGRQVHYTKLVCLGLPRERNATGCSSLSAHTTGMPKVGAVALAEGRHGGLCKSLHEEV